MIAAARTISLRRAACVTPKGMFKARSPLAFVELVNCASYSCRCSFAAAPFVIRKSQGQQASKTFPECNEEVG